MFKHKTPVELRFADVDPFGHINNAKYLTYIEQARIRYFDQVVDWQYDWAVNGIILAKAEIDFILPIRFRDEITIYTRCSRIGNKSFDLEYQLVKFDNGKEILMADACTVMVAFNYKLHKSIEVPQEWRETLIKYEGEGVIVG